MLYLKISIIKPRCISVLIYTLALYGGKIEGLLRPMALLHQLFQGKVFGVDGPEIKGS